MKKQIDKERIVTIIFAIIIGLVLLVAVFLVFKSNNYFYSNEGEKMVDKNMQDQNIQDLNTKNENTALPNEISEEEKNKMNVKQPEPAPQVAPNPPKEEEISLFTTSIYDKDENRVFNISKAMETLNGTVVKSGETFSFNNTIGPMNESNGFKKALGFDSNGKKIQISGGGLCQISSTLYNAVLMANLEVLERHPHSRRVYYVAKDKDATIMYGTLDFKFKNTTNSNLRIDASNTNSDVSVKLVAIK